ncbi:uncharacterized protein BYT42DRAFT_563061 [Radiomyces spectabilis]|uniref:uncharacterized protein n=1 Tax=Radiomyces spectabilis TaxID=64574 RepID=UPI002220703A|nr:uncharacterized protein BYT42DRAFT_563061 [Radiomyces spectabilis]KAI8384607.1 hypothetical protein BYT42DRAFT_563061 [Radiomyces spectabilis]
MYDQKKDKPKDYLLGLHWAATTGNVGLVKFALDHGAPIDSVVNGFMPLQLACISDNNIAVVQYLIDRGAQVNAQRWSKKHSADKSQAVAGATGSTALHVACANGCAKIVDLLLRNNAQVDVKDKYGSTPMDVAAAKHYMEIAKLLETFGQLQKQQKKEHEQQQQQQQPYQERRSMDLPARDERIERLRRPSLPSIFEGKSQKLDVPPLSTLPQILPSRQSLNTARPSLDDLPDTSTPSSSIDIHRRRPSRNKTPELASSLVSSPDDSTIIGTPPAEDWETVAPRPKKCDWYGHGVISDYGDESYLASLERKAFNLEDRSRASLDQYRTRNSMDGQRPSLKRCSSDGGRLRTTALMNAMAAKAANNQEYTTTDGQSTFVDEEAMPRPSVAVDDGPEAEALRHFQEKEMKKAWWSAFGGRKSMDAATYHHQYQGYTNGRYSADVPRKSLDFRPSFDGLSQLAKKTMEPLSRKSIDDDDIDLQYPMNRSNNRPGFFSRWVGAWSKK